MPTVIPSSFWRKLLGFKVAANCNGESGLKGQRKQEQFCWQFNFELLNEYFLMGNHVNLGADLIFEDIYQYWFGTVEDMLHVTVKFYAVILKFDYVLILP